MIKITLENGVELTCSGNFEITKRIADITDISKRSGSFSKGLTIDGTKDNIKALGGYFDVNLTAATFNHEKKYRCQVEVDGTIVEEQLIFKLTGINKKKLAHGTDNDWVSFDAVVYNDVASFYQSLGSKLVEDLKIHDPSDAHELNLTNIRASYDHDVTDKYVYILPYKNDYIYYTKQWVLSIFAKTIFDAIFESNGFVYEWTEATGDKIRFDKWIIPFTGKYKRGDYTKLQEQVVLGQNPNPLPDDSPIDASLPIITYEKHCGVPFNPNTVNDYCLWDKDYNLVQYGSYPIYTPDVASNASSYMKVIGNEVVDLKGQYNNTTGVFTPNINGTYDIELDIEWKFGIEAFNINGGELGSPSGDGFVKYEYIPFFLKNGNIIQAGWGGFVQFNDGDTISFGLNYTTGNTKLTITDTFATTDTIQLIGFRQKISRKQSTRWAWLDQSTGDKIDVETSFEVTDITVKITPRETYQDGISINLNEFLPKKIKQAEFVKSILNMTNSYVDIDPNQDNKLIIKTRDKYYKDGQRKNFSKYLDNSKESKITFISNEQSKVLELSYKDDNDPYNEAYKTSVQRTYGDVRYTLANEHIKGETRKEIAFSPTPYAQNQFGGYCPCITPLIWEENNIRVLLWNGKKSVPSPPFVVYDSSGAQISTGETYYPQALHVDNPTNPTFDLNFGICNYYFVSGVVPTINNLFTNHFRTLYAQLNSGKKRVSYFSLPEKERRELKLSDIIEINNSRYMIDNFVNNYGVSKQTKITLLTIDDDISIKPIRNTATVGLSDAIGYTATETNQTPSIATTNAIKETNNINNSSSIIIGEGNNVASGVDAMIIGNNNRVTATNAFVLGDGNNAERDGIYTPALFIEGVDVAEELSKNGKVIFHALATQSGTSAPTLEIFTSDFESVTPSRTGTGDYSILFGETLPDNIELIINQSLMRDATRPHYARGVVNTSSIDVFSYDPDGKLTDGILNVHIKLIQYG